jgi:outer membrane biosynthesis protein TonB
VKRLLALLAGGLGLRALLKRRSRPALQPSPAEDLRAKLAQTKAQETPTKSHETQTQSHETPTQEPQTKEPEPEPEPERAQPETVEERRADVHSKARQAIDDLGQS